VPDSRFQFSGYGAWALAGAKLVGSIDSGIALKAASAPQPIQKPPADKSGGGFWMITVI
jgi:hypothetical protein